MQLDTNDFKYVRLAEVDDNTGLITVTLTFTALDTIKAVSTELDDAAMALVDVNRQCPVCP